MNGVRLKISLLFFLLPLFFTASAQFRLPLGNSDVRQALEKVVSDFSSGFATLKGEVLHTNPQSVEYVSLLEFKTAEQNTITQYSGDAPVYSWQAVMFTSEEYEAAAKKYKALYSQLKGMSLTVNRDYSYGLSGQYDPPSEGKKFFSSTFRLLPQATYLPKLRVELLMQYELLEWKVYLLVYQKEREDYERGMKKDQ